MPCSSSESMTDYPPRSREERAMREELDRVTAMLCRVVKSIVNTDVALDGDIVEWADKHSEFDRSQGR